ncbi:MAG: PAS domain S-box protein [Methanomicrobiales archaeon]
MTAGKKKPEHKEPETPGIERTLRDVAEEQLARSPKRSPGMEGQTPEQLVHELSVHQIELEMQAEALRSAQNALEESREKFLDLYEFAPLGYFTLTDKALIAEVNLTGATLIGVERKKLLVARFRKFVSPGDFEQWDRYLIRLLMQDNNQSCILTLKRGDGSTFPARLEGIRTNGFDGIISVRIAISDITDIWQIEALKVSETRYRRLFETAQDGILILDAGSGQIVEVNPFLIDMLGFSREQFLGKKIWEIGLFKDIVANKENFEELQRQEYIRYEDMPLETAGGQRIAVEFISNVYMVSNKKVIQCNIRDITARKRVEDALALTSKKLNLLSGITRHDINNQLTILLGYLKILENKQSDPTLIEYFLKVSNAAKRISAMIRFTKEYEEIGVHAPTWQDTRTLIATAAKQAPLGQVVVKNDLPAGAEVFADPLMVKVFYNLMDNAARYGGKITTIRFSALDRDGDDHLIVCEDDGEGVPQDEKERIFERGFGKNTGLGLALSREILSITGITIRETGEPGKGARFEMVVPKGMWRNAGEGIENDSGKKEAGT